MKPESSPFCCPVCAGKLAEQRRKELRFAVQRESQALLFDRFNRARDVFRKSAEHRFNEAGGEGAVGLFEHIAEFVEFFEGDCRVILIDRPHKFRHRKGKRHGTFGERVGKLFFGDVQSHDRFLLVAVGGILSVTLIAVLARAEASAVLVLLDLSGASMSFIIGERMYLGLKK